MNEESKLSVVFSDGTRVNFGCPPPSVAQDPGNVLQSAFEQGWISLEVEGDLVVVPLANIKYIRLTPAPGRTSGVLLRGARIIE